MSHLSDDVTPPQIFLQFKNTDICFDFTCDCEGGGGHYDGYFGNHIKCGYCGRHFLIPHMIAVEEMTEAEVAEWNAYFPDRTEDQNFHVMKDDD